MLGYWSNAFLISKGQLAAILLQSKSGSLLLRVNFHICSSCVNAQCYFWCKGNNVFVCVCVCVCVNGFDASFEFTVLLICQTRLFKYFHVVECYTFLVISFPWWELIEWVIHWWMFPLAWWHTYQSIAFEWKLSLADTWQHPFHCNKHQCGQYFLLLLGQYQESCRSPR